MASLTILCYFVAEIFYILNFASVDGKMFFDRSRFPPPGEPNGKVAMTWRNFTQRLDHFNPQDNRTWTMRYLYKDQYFQSGGPVFILIGGEWAIELEDIDILGQPFELAQRHNGYLFYTEHRFYGQSYPTKDFSIENLKYLTTEQALEDLAHFIQHQRALPKLKNSSVVVIGGSYSAMLATWLRLKYPHLVDIAYASSPILLAKDDAYEYLEVVSEVIEKTNKTCFDAIQQAISITEDLLMTAEGVAKIKKAYGLCSWNLITEEPHRSYLFYNIARLFSDVVQGGDNMTNVCDELIKGGQNHFDQLTSYVRNNSDHGCMINYDKYMSNIADTSLSELEERQWTYQVCTEYGNRQTSSSIKQIFGHSVSLPFFYRVCQDAFGSNFGAETQHYGVKRTNLLYGSVNPKLSYVLFVHGLHDPWHPLGILKNLTSLSPVILIEGESHCKDLQWATSNDSPQLVRARRQIQTIISDWLKEII